MECIVCLYGCHGIFKFKYRKANQNESRPRIMKKRKKQLFSLFCITLAQVAVCVFMGAYVLVIGVLWGMCVRIVDCVGCMMCSTDCRMQCQQQHFLPFSLQDEIGRAPNFVKTKKLFVAPVLYHLPPQVGCSWIRSQQYAVIMCCYCHPACFPTSTLTEENQPHHPLPLSFKLTL